ncbi:iron chelate uptake ABC transporter family permease subunit [Leptospira interrogans]
MPASLDQNRNRPVHIIGCLTVVVLVAAAAFMTVGAKGNWDFVLPFRGAKLAVLVLVAYAIAVSTVLFQTVTANRILTPALMGLDALYQLIQTSLVFMMGAVGAATLDPQIMFLAQCAVMAGFACVLYRSLFSGRLQSLHLVMLVGLVIGVLFRSLSHLMQRIMAPNDFMVLQDRLFANFNTVNSDVLMISAASVLVVTLAGVRSLAVFDVLALGREIAISLGVDYRRTVTQILILISVLVSVATALVGPVTFFGLLVASLAYQIAGSSKHRHVLPIAVLLAMATLIIGQMVLERVFAFDTALSIIIEFAGGLAFIFLVLRRGTR